MTSYRFVPISSRKGVLFFETPGSFPPKFVIMIGATQNSSKVD